MTNNDGDGGVDCREAESLLLEADLPELQGGGGGPLAVHLRRCDACRRRAAQILAAQRALDDALGERASRRPVDSVLRAVREELAADRKEANGGAPSVRWTVALPLAAAAFAALALWSSGPGEDSRPVSPVVRPAWSVPSSAAPKGPTGPGLDDGGLRVEADGRFALMKTGSPTISVVWFY